MSFDPTLNRREAILQRLFVLGQGLPNIASAYRDHGPTQTGDLGVLRPAFLLYDGSTRLIQELARHKQPLVPPTLWRMESQIVVQIEKRDTVANDTLAGISRPQGPEISDWMDLVYQTIINDPVIVDLVTPNGTHSITSIETDLRIGQTVGMIGGAWMLATCVFEYPVFPAR